MNRLLAAVLILAGIGFGSPAQAACEPASEGGPKEVDHSVVPHPLVGRFRAYIGVDGSSVDTGVVVTSRLQARVRADQDSLTLAVRAHQGNIIPATTTAQSEVHVSTAPYACVQDSKTGANVDTRS